MIEKRHLLFAPVQTYAPTPEMAEILGCELPSMKASGGRKKFRTMDIRDWEPNDPASKNALNAWVRGPTGRNARRATSFASVSSCAFVVPSARPFHKQTVRAVLMPSAFTF